jgi:uncharacterized membrane protein YfcA
MMNDGSTWPAPRWAAFSRRSIWALALSRLAVHGRNKLFMLVMAVGSVVGTFIGGRLLGLVPNYILLPILAAVLWLSAMKV